MGQRRKRLERFLKVHPYCCFCGGGTAAATRDHIPPRNIFFGSYWPEGYEFPACYSCNNGSSGDDAIVGFFSRFNAGREAREDEIAEWKKSLRAFRERHPEEARKLLLTANEKRRQFSSRNLAKPEGIAYGELPILRVTPLMRESIDRFARKMVLALHYKHTQRIAPRNAWVFTQLRTNFHKLTNEIPQEIFDLVPKGVILRRQHIPLAEQFDYRFSVSDDGELGAYVAMFRRSFMIVGLLSFDPNLMKDADTSSIEDEFESKNHE